MLGLVLGLVTEQVLIRVLFTFLPDIGAGFFNVNPVLAAVLPGMLGVGLAMARRRRPEPSRGLRWRPSASGLATTLAIGLACLAFGLLAGPASAVAAGLAALVVFGFASGLEGVPRDLNAAASPRSVLAHDRRAALVNGLAGLLTVGGLAGLLAVGLAARSGIRIAGGSGYTFSTAPAARLAAGLDFGLTAGIVAGIVFGLTSSTLNTAWPSYQLARGWLAAGRRLPWSLMSFLDDAHQRSVLRQDGAVYQFRHIELQHRLASRPRLHGRVE